MTKTISRGQLRDLLAAQRGAQLVTIVARTSARARKRNNPHWPVTKLARVNGVIGFNYGSCVRRQQVREGRKPTFAAESRGWGNRADPLVKRPRREPRRRGICPLVSHKGKDYLDMKVERVVEANYFDGHGAKLQLDQVQPFLPVRKSEARHQGVKRAIVLRDYNLDAIESISIGGCEYRIKR